MKNAAQISGWWKTLREQTTSQSIFEVLVLPVGFSLGAAISIFNITYGIAAAGILIFAFALLLRLDELTLTLIIAVHVLVDWYLSFRLVSVLMALVLLFVCYIGRSANHPWFKPRPVWLWSLFLTLTIYPAINGGILRLYDADTFYPSIVLSAFMMFWLGNIVAKDILSLQRTFQLLGILATLFAIHTIIEATTGKFLFESARAEAALLQFSNFQLSGGTGISRAGSFFGNPNGNAVFLAPCFFLQLGLFLASRQFWVKLIYLLEMFLILLALTFTYSTGSWVATIVSILAFVIFVGSIRYKVLLLILIAILTVVVFAVFPSQLAVQLAHATAQNESSLHLGGWQTAFRVIEAYPLFGVGLGGQAYMLRSDSYRVPAQFVPLQEPDNSYLQWGAMAGIPVMMIFLLLLGYVFWISWRNWRTIDARYRPLLGGGIAALLALSINSLSVDGWTGPGGTVNLGWLIAGLVTSPLIVGCARLQEASSLDKMEDPPIQDKLSQMDKVKQVS